MTAPNPQHSVRLSSTDKQALLCALEKQADDRRRDSRRTHQRSPFHGRDVLLTVHNTGGTARQFVTCARNISAGGACLLHGGFVHEGTGCDVALGTLWGDAEHISGVIVRCRHVEGQVHELGISFEKEIDPRCFTVNATSSAQSSRAPKTTHPINGRVLYLDKDPAQLQLLSMHLRNTDIKLTTLESVAKALPEVEKSAYDLFMCELDLGDIRGEAVIQAVRSAGLTLPIVVITDEVSPERLRSVRLTGAIAVLLKPVNPEQLIKTLSRHLPQQSAGPEAEAPIVSLITDDDSANGLIESYIAEVHRIVEKLKRAVETESESDAKRLLQQLINTADGYGFPALGETAKSCAQAMNSGPPNNARMLEPLLSIASRMTQQRSAP